MDDVNRPGRHTICVQLGDIDPANIRGIGTARRRPPVPAAAQIVDDDIVVFDAPVFQTMHAIHDVDDGTNVDVESGLLLDLAYDRRLERFPELDRAPGKIP